MRIRELPNNERPREKLAKCGVKNLSNSELLAIILRTGSKEENILELSNKIFGKYNLRQLSKLSLNQIQKEKGIGFAKACQILAWFEFGKRLNSFNEEEKPIIKRAKDVAKLFLSEMGNLDKENFKGVFLDTRNKILRHETIFIGTLNESIIHPRDIFKIALEENAASVIFLHNHPAGNLEPSEEDIKTTKELIEAGNLLGINVLDHLIIGKNKYLSMQEEKLAF